MRNPFSIRAAEQVDSDSAFLGLFEAGVLDLLPGPDAIWSMPMFIRSAPGGGKTSLLRLFTPGPLASVRDYPGQADLMVRLVQMGGLDNLHEPAVLGVRINLDAGYEELENVLMSESNRQKAFCALLNSRVVIHVLRNSLMLAGLRYPTDLDQVRLEVRSDHPEVEDAIRELGGTTGLDLHDKARKVERSILDIMNSLDDTSSVELRVPRKLVSLDLFGASNIKVGSRRLPRLLLMFDDAHKLPLVQRKMLFQALSDRSLGLSRWVAERRQALSLEEMIEEGSRQGRDYLVLDLENERETPFKRRVFSIANRRLRLASQIVEADLDFDSLITSPIGVERAQWGEIISTIRTRIEELTTGSQRFTELITHLDDNHSLDQAGAREWRVLEIFIRRELSKQQMTLDLEIPAEEFEQKSNDYQAADLFLAREFKLPYYFSPDKVAILSSKNVDQFLTIAGGLFEEIAVSARLKRGTRLLAVRQDKIIREVADRYLKQIAGQVRYGHDVVTFVTALGRLAREVTFSPTASYAPGVTGTAILWGEYQQLLDLAEHPQYRPLFNVLQSATANNILELRPRIRCKGQEFLVIYLNRLLCVPFGLPLQYGGFRERKLDVLAKWVTDPYNAKGN